MITAQETIIRVSWLINLHVDMYKYKDMNKYIPMAGVASMLHASISFFEVSHVRMSIYEVEHVQIHIHSALWLEKHCNL